MEDREPTVLDYVKSKLMPWKGIRIEIPDTSFGEFIDKTDVAGIDDEPLEISLKEEGQVDSIDDTRLSPEEANVKAISLPWKSFLAIGLALFAQLSLEPPDPNKTVGIVLYCIAAGIAVWATINGEWQLASIPKRVHHHDPLTVRQWAFWIGLVVSLVAFLALGGNRFTVLNVTLWLIGLAAMIAALWLPDPQRRLNLSDIFENLQTKNWQISISRWTLALLSAFGLVLFFRFFRLNQVPPEMFSDHAEKLLDVWDVLNGETRIFFPRNTGREALQMYLTAGIAKYLNTGLSFLSLKLGTVLAGAVSLPFIYLLGKEVGNRRVGLFALIFAGIAYWPNVISRVGLRFPLYPLFVAPVLYFLIRGFQTSNRNDFILAGVALGMGLHGYSSTRLFPIVVVMAFALYLLHRQSKGYRRQTIFGFMILVLLAFMVFLPLFRYALEDPGMFNYRTLSRIGSIERPLQGPAWQIFLENLWNAVTMFAWSNGETWVHSIPHRPALDIVSAAFFYLGVVLIFIRYLRNRYWMDIFLILSIPFLMMPSILSLAFPSENPSLNRTAGAIIPVFLIVGLGLDGFLSQLESSLSKTWGKRLAWVVGLSLLVWSSLHNYELVFNQYYEQFRLSAWNTSEVGHVIRSFSDSVGTPDNAWVVGSPHWVDTRLVGINAGYPTKDYAIWPEHFHDTLTVDAPKMFIIRPEEEESRLILQEMYPEGWLTLYKSEVPTKDFYIFVVPPTDDASD
jgi:hypothetical protein